MIVVHAGSEVVPFSKTGGLADVLGALPSSLAKRGHEVIVVSPLYRSATDKKPVKQQISLGVRLGDRTLPADVYSLRIGEHATAYFIANDALFLRDGLYVDRNGVDYGDNSSRFIFFSRAVLELMEKLDIVPDVVHSHDWQTGLVPAYLRTLYRDYFKGTVSVFTIHNIGYQGTFWHLDMPLTGLGWEYFTKDYLEFYGKISLLKAGIVFSDAVTTVSPTYSREILTPEFGYGMEGVLKTREPDLFGILNGVDYGQWAPEHDRLIPHPYGMDAVDLKQDNKITLNKMFGLDDSGAPLIGMITRLAQQKGIDIVIEAVGRMVAMGLKLVLLGSGDKTYEDRIKDITGRYRGRVGARIGFDNSLAHLIEAGADMFLMPSLYEPCGLNQMYSLRYGTVPVVRATGGLNDTVAEYDPTRETGNGFKFRDQSADGMLLALKRAVDAYNDRPRWQRLTRACMSYDFSWDRSSEGYELLYGAYRTKSYLHGYRSKHT
ncbi:MAG: glycogen synthase GlgA [Deltaproteobacteria bacterium]|nr:glycogen synthase GlgA [Deltaproteobacteria bacterium]